MSESSLKTPHRILIVSANPLFGNGLRKLMSDRWQQTGAQVQMATATLEAEAWLIRWQPDLLIVDQDDPQLDRALFLRHLLEGPDELQVMVVTLRSTCQVKVYDRHTLTTDQAQDWLDLP